jgi:alpha-beta hydrolase superfamily lysophospholipase
MKFKDFFRVLFVIFISLSVTFALFGVFGACDGDDDDDDDICYESAGSSGDVDSSRLYYPCNVGSMSNVGATTLSGGMTNDKEDMYWIAETLAEEGLIVLAISADDNMSISGYDDAHHDAFTMLHNLNSSSSSPVNGTIGNYGLMGFSMGGGAVLQVGHDLTTQVTSIVSMAPFAEDDVDDITASTLIIVGTDDNLCPGDSYGHKYFEDLGSIDKAYALVEGENHLFWMSDNSSTQVDDFLAAWQKYYLEGDSSYYAMVENPPSKISDYTFCPDGVCSGGGGCGN